MAKYSDLADKKDEYFGHFGKDFTMPFVYATLDEVIAEIDWAIEHNIPFDRNSPRELAQCRGEKAPFIGA